MPVGGHRRFFFVHSPTRSGVQSAVVKSDRLTILSAISVSVLAILLSGYFAEVGPGYISIHRANGASYPRITLLVVEDGRVLFTTQAALPQSYLKLPPAGPFMVTRLRTPSLSRSLWEFDAHTIPLQPGATSFLIGFPIWCLAVPLMIAPGMWWRRHRQHKKNPRGFDVGLPAAEAQA
jgi:hypothetical protein